MPCPPSPHPSTRLAQWLCARLVMLLALTGWAGHAWAQPIDLAPLHNGQSLISQMQALQEQPDTALQIDDAVASAHWVPATPDSLPSIMRRSTMWLTALVSNDSAAPITRWLAVGYWRLADVQLFLVDPNTGTVVAHSHGGLAHPRSERVLPLPTMESVFPVELKPRQSLRLVLRVHSNGWRTINVNAWEPSRYTTSLNLTQAAHSAVAGMGLAVVLILLLTRRNLYWLLAAWLALALAFATVNLGYGVPWLSQFLPAGKLSALVAALAVWSGVPMVLATGMILGAHKKVFWRRMLSAVVIVSVIGSVSLFFVSAQWLRPLVAVLMIALLIAWPPLVIFARHKKQHTGVLLPALLTLSWVLLALRLLSYMTAVLVQYERVLYAANLYGQVVILLLIIGRAALLQRSRELRIEQWLKESRHRRRKKLEQLVRQRTDQLEQSVLAAQEANHAKTEFLGHASHDLRSPLATIVGYAQMLQGKATQQDTATELAVISRTADHMLNVINDLADYTRDAGKDRIDPQPVCTAWLIDVIAPQAQGLAAANHNVFSLNLRTAMPPVIVVDGGRLRRILVNLLDNAAKFTRHGRITLSIGCAPADEPGRVCMQFAVSDTGCGIQPEDQAKILEPFFRGRSSHGTPGVGLGMRIVSMWVQRMGGRLHIKSVPGQGTDVAVELTFPVSDQGQVPPVNGQGYQLWGADDVPEMREHLADMLKRHGFDVVPSSDGAAFIQAERAPGTMGPGVANHAGQGTARQGDVDGALAAHGLLTPTMPAAYPAAPPENWLAELAHLVDMGALTDIEEWACRLIADAPEYTPFARTVKQLAEAVDLHVLHALIASNRRRAPNAAVGITRGILPARR